MICAADELIRKDEIIVDENNKDGIVMAGTEETPAATENFSEYQVSVTAPGLNVRKKPDIRSEIVKILINDQNTYTIVEEIDGPINDDGKLGRWGQLKHGLGWILLTYTKKR